MDFRASVHWGAQISRVPPWLYGEGQRIHGSGEGSRQLGAWKTNSINKRRASSSGLGPVTALDLLRPSKNTCNTPRSISYSPVYFLCLMSRDIGDRIAMIPSFDVQRHRILGTLLATDGFDNSSKDVFHVPVSIDQLLSSEVSWQTLCRRDSLAEFKPSLCIFL